MLMTKKYELTCVLDPQIGDSGYETQVEKVEERLKLIGAEVVAIDRWGLRKLAYNSVGFKRRQQGYFVLYQFSSDSQPLVEFQQELKLDNSVLRHLLLVVEGEFLRVPQLAPENVYVYTREDRGGPRFGRGRRDQRDDDSRDERRGPKPATSREEGGITTPAESKDEESDDVNQPANVEKIAEEEPSKSSSDEA